ncbi:MAG TPA: hypothetical protein VFK47_11515 [Ktedonobacteraceae bacterium]|jgi:hypothetical protein|nr:hypothetical protein [Ktedonobacteraceae bacterium]
MRLKNVEHGHRESEKLLMEHIQAARGEDRPMPDVIRMLLYRPEIFGTPFSLALEEIMHGPSDWSVGERELFATFVSSKNQCSF